MILARLPGEGGVLLPQVALSRGHGAAAGGGKGHHRFAGEVAAFQEGVHGPGLYPPPYCVSKLIQSTSCGYRFLIYENTTIYVLFHSSPRTHMVLGIVFRLAIPD